MNHFVKNVLIMLDKFFSTKLELNQNFLKKNIKFLKSQIGNKTEIIAVLKANAYGFGDISQTHEFHHLRFVYQL